MVLLDVMSKLAGLEIIVAHFEHGIRTDSDQDREFVEAAAKRYGLRFLCEHGTLGEDASEAMARDARYTFLRRAKDQYHADAIVTAHHQDDLIETAVLNVLRGTGRKGLSSLGSTKEIVRPLLHVNKVGLLRYATDNKITWHEDSTNLNDSYLRNYVRIHILSKLGGEGKSKLLSYIEKAIELNPVIDGLLTEDLESKAVTDTATLERMWFVMLPYEVSCEAMAVWLRSHGIREFDKKMIERLVVASKVATPGKTIDINAEHLLKVAKTTLQLLSRTTSSKQIISV